MTRNDPLSGSDAPFVSGLTRIEESFLDYNGHMNLAYYQVLFDRFVDVVFEHIGIGRTYFERTNHSGFAAEVHIVYKRELRLDDPVRVTWRLIDFDEKRIHFFQEMHHAAEGWLSATTENLGLHIDMAQRKVVPYPPELMETFAALKAAHGALPVPEQVGRKIGIARR
jgi:acyl-CoA thioester hydrolase